MVDEESENKEKGLIKTKDKSKKIKGKIMFRVSRFAFIALG